MKKSDRLWMKRVCTDDDGYKKTDIAGKLFFVHRLVALVFIDNDDYEHKNLVNHVNHIRHDNRAGNLEWCDFKYNNQRPFDRAAQQRINQINQVNAHISEPLMRIGSIDGKDLVATKSAVKSYRFDEIGKIDYREEWKPFSEMPEHSMQCLRPREKELLQSNLYASTHGRFAAFDGKRFVLKKVCNEKNGYMFVSIHHTVQRVHRLIALMFVYDDNMLYKECVDHINHVHFRNDVQNLRWVTSSENRNNLVEGAKNAKGVSNVKNIGKKGTPSHIRCTNMDTGEIVIYDNITDASIKLNVAKDMITRLCQRNMNGSNELISIDSTRFKLEYEKVILHNKDAIVQMTIRGEFIKLFKTTMELKEVLRSIDKDAVAKVVYSCCRRNRGKDFPSSSSYGYAWAFLDDYNEYPCSNERLDLEEMVMLTTKNEFIGVYSRHRMLDESKSLDMVYKFYDVPINDILNSFKYAIVDRGVRCKWVRAVEYFKLFPKI